MGYIDEDGNYHDDDAPDWWQRLRHPPHIFEDVTDYAEVAIDMRAEPILYGLSSSELAQLFFQEVRARHNWETVAEGAISYPVDLMWFGYTVAAGLGGLGDEAQRRVDETWARTRDITAEAANTVLQIGAGAVTGGLEQAVDQGGVSATKLTFAANVIINHLAHGGALHMAGRYAGGIATRYILGFLISQGVGRFYPPATLSVGAIAQHPILTKSLLYMTKVGSITRKGDLLITQRGGLDSMGLIDTLVTLLTGESDPEGVSSTMREMTVSLRGMMERLSSEIRQELLDNRMSRPSYYGEPRSDQILRELGNEAGSIAIYALNPYNSEAFLDGAIRAHNLSVALYRNGYRTDLVNRIRTLGDPTMLVWVRAYMASLTSLMANIANMPAEQAWWEMMMRRELERPTNDPSYVLGD